jgi:hypothetical protein
MLHGSFHRRRALVWRRRHSVPTALDRALEAHAAGGAFPEAVTGRRRGRTARAEEPVRQEAAASPGRPPPTP